MTKTKYEIKTCDGWQTVTKAVEIKMGFLQWDLRQGESLVSGMSGPGKWRIKK